VYIETTVVSYLVAGPNRSPVVAGHQEATKRFWQFLPTEFDAHVSALVVQEASRGDPEQARKRLVAIKPFPVLQIDKESQALADRILAGRGIPEEYPEDALHIAIAAVNGVNFVVTWNFGHINNPFTRMMIRQIVENEGYVCPELCSPDELLGDEI